MNLAQSSAALLSDHLKSFQPLQRKSILKKEDKVPEVNENECLINKCRNDIVHIISKLETDEYLKQKVFKAFYIVA